MRPWLDLPAGLVAALTLLSTTAFAQPAPSKAKSSPKETPSSAAPKTSGSPSPTKSAPTPGEPKPISIPVPPGQTVKGIKIPYFDLQGKLRMQFFADEAFRVDDEHVKMARLKVELIGEEGAGEDLMIDLPASELDLKTQIISSSDPVKLSRSDFMLEGETMEFDTRTRKGVLRGKVRMQIFDRSKL